MALAPGTCLVEDLRSQGAERSEPAPWFNPSALDSSSFHATVIVDPMMLSSPPPVAAT